MIKDIITNISEDDFRKLNLVGYHRQKVVYPTNNYTRIEYVPVPLNEILDNEIRAALDIGTEDCLDLFNYPVTIAIHEENDMVKDNPNKVTGYWDKFMNRFGGGATYEVGVGIKHLYSTRDYFECKEDYWRVAKKETKKIYRITLDPKWKEQFKLKYKTERKQIGPNSYLEKYYQLDERTNEFVLMKTCEVTEEDGRTTYTPINL